MRLTFRFRWGPFVATALAVALGVALAQWQTRRALEKEAVEARMSAQAAATPLDLNSALPRIDEAEFRRAVVKGEFVRDWPVYLDNRPYQGNAGFYLLMPFRIAGSDQHVLVARGWIKRAMSDRTRFPPITTPSGIVQIEGVIRCHPGHVLQLGRPEPLHPGAIVQNLGVQEFAQASKLNTIPLMIEQVSDTQDGLVRDWPQPSAGVEKHRGYAFQWYALAATALLFFIVTGFRRGTK